MPAAAYDCAIEVGVIRGADLVAAAHDDLAAGRDRAEIAAAFHEGVAAAFATACSEAGGAGTVVLSGGCLQNLRLLELAADAARAGRASASSRMPRFPRTTAASATVRRRWPLRGSPCA